MKRISAKRLEQILTNHTQLHAYQTGYILSLDGKPAKPVLSIKEIPGIEAYVPRDKVERILNLNRV